MPCEVDWNLHCNLEKHFLRATSGISDSRIQLDIFYSIL